MSDDEWAKHTAFIQGEFEAEVKRSQDAGLEPPSFTEFARPFADRFYGAEVREQVAALRAQAEELRRIMRNHGDSAPAHEGGAEDEEGLVSNIAEMTYDAGSLDAAATAELGVRQSAKSERRFELAFAAALLAWVVFFVANHLDEILAGDLLPWSVS